MLQWARANGCPWDKWTCEGAARGGYLDVLQWARANGCPWNAQTCYSAAEGGHLKVLQWARANGCPWDSDTGYAATENGHLEVLQWARTNGCPWDNQTCSAAAGGGHLKMLQWARANGCPWDKYTCAMAAKAGPHPRDEDTCRREPRGAAVGSRERMPVERTDVLLCGGGWALRDSELTGRARTDAQSDGIRTTQLLDNDHRLTTPNHQVTLQAPYPRVVRTTAFP